MIVIMMIIQLLVAFGLTLAVECGLCAAVFRQKSIVRLCFWTNLLTNPLLNILRMLGFWLGPLFFTTLPWLLIMELCVVLVEGWAYRYALGWGWLKALGLSLVFNAASFLLGLGLLQVYAIMMTLL